MRDWTRCLKYTEEYGPNSLFDVSYKQLSGRLDLVEIFSNNPDKFSNVKIVRCECNQLKGLIIPDGIIYIYCSGNQLTELNLHKGVKVCYCSHNHLTKLILPKGVRFVDCSNNYLPKPFKNQRPINELISNYTILLEEYVVVSENYLYTKELMNEIITM